MMLSFIYQLHAAGIPVSIQYIIDFTRALQKGLAADVDGLFLLARLIFVKKIEHLDIFERIFAAHFLDSVPPRASRDWEEMLFGKPLDEWLRERLGSAPFSLDGSRRFETEALLTRLWETLIQQRGRHEGGHTWVGSHGTSPFGHSGREGGGVRVHGESRHGTAQKVIARRNFINYADHSALSSENLRQALTALKSLRPVGPLADLDIDESIRCTAANGGEIELVFRRETRNRVQLLVLLDNGGYSMTPHIPLVRTVFSHIRDLFRDLKFYYFHNCIYGEVFQDPPRTSRVSWEKLVGEDRRTRLIIIGDANMAPSELMAAFGSLGVTGGTRKPGWEWLKELREAYPVSAWLNPIPKHRWQHESLTIHRIREIFPMQELTVGGIREAVACLNAQGAVIDRC